MIFTFISIVITTSLAVGLRLVYNLAGFADSKLAEFVLVIIIVFVLSELWDFRERFCRKPLSREYRRKSRLLLNKEFYGSRRDAFYSVFQFLFLVCLSCRVSCPRLSMSIGRTPTVGQCSTLQCILGEYTFWFLSIFRYLWRRGPHTVTGDLKLVFFGRHENASSSVLLLSSLTPAF